MIIICPDRLVALIILVTITVKTDMVNGGSNPSPGRSTEGRKAELKRGDGARLPLKRDMTRMVISLKGAVEASI